MGIVAFAGFGQLGVCEIFTNRASLWHLFSRRVGGLVTEILLMRFFLLCGLAALAACSRSDTSEERFQSGLRDDLSGVWVYPAESQGQTVVVVVDGHRWQSFLYKAGGIDVKADAQDAGEVLGEEGVYFFANRGNFYNPVFFQRAPDGTPFMILSRASYDGTVRSGKLPADVWIRVADRFDPAQPPARPSIKALGLPHR